MMAQKNPLAVELGRRGGLARVAAQTPEQQSELGRSAARARWDRRVDKLVEDFRVTVKRGGLETGMDLMIVVDAFLTRIERMGRRTLFYHEGELWDGNDKAGDLSVFRHDVIGIFDGEATRRQLIDEIVAAMQRG